MGLAALLNTTTSPCRYVERHQTDSWEKYSLQDQFYLPTISSSWSLANHSFRGERKKMQLSSSCFKIISGCTQKNMNLKCRNQSHLRQVSGAFLQDMAPVAIQSYYMNHKGAAFTLGLITVMRIKSHFAAAFQDFSTAYFPLPSSPLLYLHAYSKNIPGAKILTRQTMTVTLNLF